jgi:thiamine pyrophosphokinase
MENVISIIANGNFVLTKKIKKIIDSSSKIICCDGGGNSCFKNNIKPTVIIGDMDSITSKNLEYFKSKGVEIIVDLDDSKTDLELGFILALKSNPNKIYIFGGLGGRFDMSIVSILVLLNFRTNKVKIIDEFNEIEVLTKSTKIKGKIGEKISIIPICKVKNLSYTGLKWEVKDLDVDIGWFGVSNKFSNENVSIDFDSGKILLVRNLRNKIL